MDSTSQPPFDAISHQFGSNLKNVYSETSDSDLVVLLHQRALTTPDACAYVFLADDGSSEQSISYGQLDAQARIIAAQLQMLDKVGKRALLLYPAGLDYIAAFLGCLYSGVIAVPAYPSSRHHANRLSAIVHDASPAVVLTTSDLCERLQESHQKAWNCHELMWLATDRLQNSNPGLWVPPALVPDSLAFLQYTSGSTGNPKGVMVSHGNLMANQKMIKKAFNHTQKTVVMGWLPLYHDMGLIGNVLQPLYLGATAILMAPLAFLEQPVRWLQAISKFRASTSGGPNFAYELCIRKITSEQKQELDLSCWTLAFNGSEPVRAATLAQFSDTFAECGFRQQAFFPCYGLAESTLFVTGHRLTDNSQLQRAQSAGDNRLEQRHHAQNQVNCGHAWDDHAVCIVNPETRTLCADGEEGEIWIAGASVTQGYWNRPEDSDTVFRASLSDAITPDIPQRARTDAIHQKYCAYSERDFLRTSDLGIIERDSLFVTGRIKDLIILRGRNYYPQDLEQAVNDGVMGIRLHCCAAFSVERAGEESLVVAAEVKRRTMPDYKAQEILSEMRRVLAEVSDAPIGELLLVIPGAIMKTSSGKIQRQAVKQAYLTNQLNIVASSGAGDTLFLPSDIAAVDKNNINCSFSDALRELPGDQRIQLISLFLQMKLSRLLGTPEANIPLASSIRSLGLDSLRVIELKHAADALLDTEIPLALFLSDESIIDVANVLATKIIHTPAPAIELPLKETMDLSCAQQAIWTVHQLEPHSIIYNLHICLHFQNSLNEGILRSALNILLQRHSQLRTRYRMDGKSVQQSVIPCDDLATCFSVVDATEWTQLSFQKDLARCVREPFNLSQGSLLRITSYQRGEQDHALLFCTHHVAIDLWTGLILLNDLKIIINGLISGQNPILPELTSEYQDFVTWQQGYLHSSTCQHDWEYWHTKLAGELLMLELPVDFPRPSVSTHRGASKMLHLDSNLTHQVKQLGQKYGATLFMTLLAVYKVLLHRYTHQDDIIVGTASNGRPQARFKSIAGNFVNPIALRSHPAPSLSFAAYLAQVRDTVVDALSHSDYPFSLLVERLQPKRTDEHWPIYQTWFALQQGPFGLDDGLTHLALGEDSEKVRWGDWTVASKGIGEQIENFDLRLMAAEDANGLLLSFKYRTDLFKAETIARMANHFHVLIKAIIAQPKSLLGELPLLTETERVQQLVKWNSLAAVVPEDTSLHALFEAQVIRTRMQTAISCNGMQLTYAALNKATNQLAHYLRAQGVGPEVTVGICLPRSLDMTIGMLGILKSGGAYVPIDVDFPIERIESLLSDAKAAILLTHQMQADRLCGLKLPIFCLDGNREMIATQCNENPKNLSNPAHLAYIIYTSGSTGKPKGVAITHGNVVHSTYARFHTYRAAQVAGFLLLSSYTFDSSVAGIFWTLCQGGCIHLPAEGAEKDPRLLGKILSSGNVTHVLSLPSLYGVLLDTISRDLLGRLNVVIVAGEACASDLVARHNQKLPHVSLFNEYGPTEGTVWSSVYQTQAEDAHHTVPIGKPIQNVQLFLLDCYLNPVPIGVSGELYIGGSGLARGYLHSPDLTAERFCLASIMMADYTTIMMAG